MNLRLVAVGVYVAWCGVGLSARADIITDWNAVLSQTIRETATSHGPSAGPGPIARASAMMFGAMYDAVNSVDNTHQSYLLNVNVPSDTSREAAATIAAHRVLTSIYTGPAQVARFDMELASHLSAIPDSPSKTAGISLGTQVADAMIANRTGDGYGIIGTYMLNPAAGNWRPSTGQSPITPHWGNVTPFAMQSGSQFRPGPPGGFTDMNSLLASPEYAAQVNEVRELGALFGSTRTADQTEIATFWANDTTGTFKPTGHLNHLNEVVAAQAGNTLSENARMFALTNLAMADAAIAAWDSKYKTDIDLWRPRDAIREILDDGNPLTTPNPTWQPLAFLVNGSPAPAFPAYISGHATFGAAQAAVLSGFFGTDNISFAITSDDTPGVYRSFDSFTEAALENGRSRVYLGVHYQWDSDVGFDTGYQLGQYVFNNYLQPLHVVPEPSTVALAAISVAALLSVGFRRRTRRLAGRTRA